MVKTELTRLSNNLTIQQLTIQPFSHSTIHPMKQIIKTTHAPDPIGPYSQGILIKDTLYISGQVALDPATGKLITINIIKETNQVMHNLMNILKEAGMDFSNVVKTTI